MGLRRLFHSNCLEHHLSKRADTGDATIFFFCYQKNYLNTGNNDFALNSYLLALVMNEFTRHIQDDIPQCMPSDETVRGANAKL